MSGFLHGHRHKRLIRSKVRKVVPGDNERLAMAVSVKLGDELTGRVRKLALTRQRSPHWVMHEAIKQYVEREEARKSFRQEALASWAAYEETGRHVTAQEARAWLNSWGSEDTGEPPERHA